MYLCHWSLLLLKFVEFAVARGVADLINKIEVWFQTYGLKHKMMVSSLKRMISDKPTDKLHKFGCYEHFSLSLFMLTKLISMGLSGATG